jgi:diguanylate cyclase (GGDEF)-like protein
LVRLWLTRVSACIGVPDIGTMDVGRFLCRDDTERRRMVDLTRNMRPGMPLVLAAFMVGGLSGVGVYGVWPLVPPAVAFAIYGVLWRLNIGRQRRPEYLWAGVIGFAEVTVAATVALASGPRAYGLVVLSMPVLLAAFIFPRRVAVAMTAFGMALVLVLLGTVDLNEIRHVPSIGLVPVFVLGSLAITALVIRDLDDATRRSALVDELTGALNRAALTPKLAELAHSVTVGGQPISVIVADIDNFKQINDRYGHRRGDWVLREIAHRLGDCVTASEPLYRLGGEEFLVLLPGVDAGAAHDVAVRMRRAVRKRPIDGVTVTMSFGVATSLVQGAFDFDGVFARADHALFTAKRAGRDRVETAAMDAPQAVAPTRPAARRTDGVSGRSVWALTATGEQRALAVSPADGQPSAEQQLSPVEDRRRAPTGAGRMSAGWTRGAAAKLNGYPSVTDELEREFILDLNQRLSKTFRVVAVGAFAVIAAGIPTFGWHTLIAPAVGAVPYYMLSQLAHRFRHPSRALVAGWALFQTSIAVGFASSHGAPLFALSFFVLMVPGRSAVFRSFRAAALGTAYTALLMTAVAFWLDPAGVLANPAILMLPLALLCEAAYLGAIVGRSTLAFRGAGIVDGLTGLLNRTALGTRLIELEAQATTVPRRVAIVVADLDHFKQINDSAGHAAGDLVLQQVADRLHGSLRSFDSVYRFGGEEFLVLLTDSDLADAGHVAERLCGAVRGTPCGGHDVTISVGVSATGQGERFVYKEVFERADTALYEAKRGGRDRVCTAGSPEPSPERGQGPQTGTAGAASSSAARTAGRPPATGAAA